MHWHLGGAGFRAAPDLHQIHRRGTRSRQGISHPTAVWRVRPEASLDPLGCRQTSLTEHCHRSSERSESNRCKNVARGQPHRRLCLCARECCNPSARIQRYPILSQLLGRRGSSALRGSGSGLRRAGASFVESTVWTSLYYPESILLGGTLAPPRGSGLVRKFDGIHFQSFNTFDPGPPQRCNDPFLSKIEELGLCLIACRSTKSS